MGERRKDLIRDLRHWAREAHGMWIIGEDNGLKELRSVLRRAASELARPTTHKGERG